MYFNLGNTSHYPLVFVDTDARPCTAKYIHYLSVNNGVIHQGTEGKDKAIYVTSFPLTTTIPSMSPTQVPSTVPQAVNTYSVFDVLNIFCACWFLNRDHLLTLVTFAQKAEDGNDVSWLEVTPQSHAHLVRQAIALAPTSYPLALVKRVMFVFLLEVVNNFQASTLDKFVKTSAS